MNEDGSNGSQSAESLSDDLFEYCQSESLSEEGLRAIIERHGLTPNNHDHVDDYDFFLWACDNERVTEGIIRCLLEYFPDAAGVTDGGWTPLHYACQNKNATLSIIKFLINTAPNSVRSVTDDGRMPLHFLCRNSELNEAAAVQILEILLEKHPAAIRHADNDGNLPIHHAASGGRSPKFCRALIEAYPGSERIIDGNGGLPLHWACIKGSLPTVEYLYSLYREAIHHLSNEGYYPIHLSILHMTYPTAAEIVQFLLDCDPDVKLQKFRGHSLLQYACAMRYDSMEEFDDSNIDASIGIFKILFDAHPETIEDDVVIPTLIRQYHLQVQAFINGELVYARQAQDLRLMKTPDASGYLPLHRALENNVRLGSIKLLVKGNPSALRTLENNLALPLHIACQHHDSASVVQYLLSLDDLALNAVDSQGNTALHYACRGAKYNTIAMLLEEYDAASVATRNAHGKLPVELLWESNAVEDRESVEYTESFFRLLRANPEMFGQ